MQTVDMLVHIDETLNELRLEAVEGGMRQAKGVMAVGHRADKPHLIQVVYDADRTRMAMIIAEVRHLGLHAQGVGL